MLPFNVCNVLEIRGVLHCARTKAMQGLCPCSHTVDAMTGEHNHWALLVASDRLSITSKHVKPARLVRYGRTY
jgi:hypothetical protein